METILYCILGIIIVSIIVVKLYMIKVGDAKLAVYTDKRTPLKVLDMTEDEVVLESVIEFRNSGKQAAVITDCLLRVHLPFEQYDGVYARGKVERSDAPREDDYFEAYIVDAGKSMQAVIKVVLTSRHDMDITEALTKMVDLPTEIIYTVCSRSPWSIKKVRVVFTAEEIARAAGIVLSEG